MNRYFIKDANGEQGPFGGEELKAKAISPDTEVRAETDSNWCKASDVEELKFIFFAQVAPQPQPVVTEPAPVKATTTTSTPIPVAAKPAGKKSTAWISYALAIVIFGGLGYYVYQDMEKNKTLTERTAAVNTADDTKNTDTKPVTTDNTVTSTNDNNVTSTEETTPPVTDPVVTDNNNNTVPVTTVPVTTTTTTTIDPAAAKKAEEAKKKIAAIEAKKKADAAAKKKADEELKKKQAAAKAQYERERDMRNNWPRYVTIGALNYEEHDGIKAFAIPVHNNFSVGVDRVTLRVDYVKKEGKLVETEMLAITNIPGRGMMSVIASGNKKAKKVNVYITGVTSRGLHFCYPVNNGSADDPYFCN
jgi:hypothetical protein